MADLAKKSTKKGSFGEKLGNFWRSLRSEFKKIVWYPWDQTHKSSVLVIIAIIIIGVFIGLIDLAFSKGLIGLGKLI